MNHKELQDRLATDASFKEGYETYKKMIFLYLEHNQMSRDVNIAHVLSRFEKYLRDSGAEKFIEEHEINIE